MAGNGHILLREAREAARISREELGRRVGVSKATIQRWEYGESLPESSDVARIGQITGDSSLWPRWMCETDEEYARRHPFTQCDQPAAMAVVRLGYEVADVQAMKDQLIRDLVNGRDDPQLVKRFIREIDEAISALAGAKAQLQKDK